MPKGYRTMSAQEVAWEMRAAGATLRMRPAVATWAHHYYRLTVTGWQGCIVLRSMDKRGWDVFPWSPYKNVPERFIAPVMTPDSMKEMLL